MVGLQCVTAAPPTQRTGDLSNLKGTDQPTELPKEWWDYQVHLQKAFDELEEVHNSVNVTEPRGDTVVENNDSSEVPRTRRKRGVCRDPDDLERQYLEFLFRRQTEVILQSRDYVLVHMLEVKQISNAQHNENFRGHADDSDTCPYQINTGAVEPRLRSECPWHYVPDSDPNRYPRIMQFARCECKKCLGRHSHRHGCEVTWYNVRVLRRTGRCVSGIYVYEPVLEPVPVACVCAQTRT